MTEGAFCLTFSFFCLKSDLENLLLTLKQILMESWFLLLSLGLAILTIGNIIAFFVMMQRYFVISSKTYVIASLLMIAFYLFVSLSVSFLPERVTHLEDGLSFLLLMAFLATGLLNLYVLGFKMIDLDKVYDFEMEKVKKGWVYGSFCISGCLFKQWRFDVKLPEIDYFDKNRLYTRIKISKFDIFNDSLTAEIV